MKYLALEIDVGPSQPQQLPTPHPRHHRQVDQGADPALLGCGEQALNRVEIQCGLFASFNARGVDRVSDVLVYELPADGVVERFAQNAM